MGGVWILCIFFLTNGMDRCFWYQLASASINIPLLKQFNFNQLLNFGFVCDCITFGSLYGDVFGNVMLSLEATEDDEVHEAEPKI
jgi:hypothetical protein